MEPVPDPHQAHGQPQLEGPDPGHDIGQLPQLWLPLKEAPSPDIQNREGHTAVRDTAAHHPIPRSHMGRSRQEPWVRMPALAARKGGLGPWGMLPW